MAKSAVRQTVIVIPEDGEGMVQVSAVNRKWINRLEKLESEGRGVTEVATSVSGAREFEVERSLIPLPVYRPGPHRVWTDEEREAARERFAAVREAVKAAKEEEAAAAAKKSKKTTAKPAAAPAPAASKKPAAAVAEAPAPRTGKGRDKPRPEPEPVVKSKKRPVIEEPEDFEDAEELEEEEFGEEDEVEEVVVKKPAAKKPAPKRK